MSQHTRAAPPAPTADPAVPGHRRPVAGMIAAVIVGVQVLFVFCLGYPALHASPHQVPFGVAGPPAQLSPLEAAVTRQPGVFDVHHYPDAAAARAAVRGRAVYGALVAAPGGPRLLVASAADPRVAALLAGEAKALGQARHTAVPVTDVVPTPSKDPGEIGSLTTLLPLILISLMLGVVLAHIERRPWRMLGWCACAAVAAGLAVSAVASALGTFAGRYWADAGVLALLVFGLGGCAAGLVAVRLRPLAGLFALTMVLLGIPGSGALVPAELLAQPWRTVGPGLPPAAALDALRGITFFGGAASGWPLTVLAAWAALGVLLAAAGFVLRRAPVVRSH